MFGFVQEVFRSRHGYELRELAVSEHRVLLKRNKNPGTKQVFRFEGEYANMAPRGAKAKQRWRL